jgi:hypothetical protein
MEWQQDYYATPERSALLDALHTFARQRPGLEFGNYGDVRAYRSELRRITAALADVRRLMTAVELSSISADALRDQLGYQGRLRLMPDGSLNYVTGQYFPVEYRPAVARVLANALWNHYRDSIPVETPNRGDSLRKQFRREFGRRIASMYFN